MSQEISVIVRVLPKNEDVDVNLPVEATAHDVIESLLDEGVGVRVDQNGQPVSYRLIPKGKNSEIDENESLGQAKIQNGDILLMTPTIVAG